MEMEIKTDFEVKKKLVYFKRDTLGRQVYKIFEI